MTAIIFLCFIRNQISLHTYISQIIRFCQNTKEKKNESFLIKNHSNSAFVQCHFDFYFGRSITFDSCFSRPNYNHFGLLLLFFCCWSNYINGWWWWWWRWYYYTQKPKELYVISQCYIVFFCFALAFEFYCVVLYECFLILSIDILCIFNMLFKLKFCICYFSCCWYYLILISLLEMLTFLCFI